MAKLLKLRRGTTTQHASFTGAEGEVTIDTTKDTAVVHDGSTQGGTPLAKEDMSNVSSASIAGRLGTDSIATTKIAGGTLPSDVKVTDSNVSGNLTIVNADVTSSAAIAGTKIAPDFGSQAVTTTGALSGSELIVSSVAPAISLVDTNSNSDFALKVDSGVFNIRDTTNTSNRFTISSDGTTTINENLDVGAGIDVTGNITATGNATFSNNIITVEGTQPRLYLKDTDNNDDFSVYNNHGQFLIYDETDSLSRFAIHSNGTITSYGNHDFNSGIDVTGAIIGDKAEFRDDGTTSPTVKIATDDSSPWALQIRNDTYWNSDSNGLKIYQDNSGNIDTRVTGNGAFINWYFNTQNGGVTDTAIHIDTNRAVNLKYQGNQKLATTNTGVTVTGTVAATSYTGDGSNLTGIQPFPAGTKMLFNQTSAPTGWTKVTTHNNKALRVVSGSAGSGGSNAFTNTLASRGITANAGNTTAAGNVSVANAGVSGNVSIANANTSGTVNNHTLSTNQMPSHSHSLTLKISQHNCRGSGCGGGVQPGSSNYSNGSNSTNNTGGNGAHSHGFSGGAHSHNASFSGSNHSHNASFSGSAHNHSISVGNLDMAVQYVDVIIATKD